MINDLKAEINKSQFERSECTRTRGPSNATLLTILPLVGIQFYFEPKKLKTIDPKYFIADAQTKIPLVENLYFCDQAATIIGTKNT
jgi:hypothetical protein